MGFFDLFRKKKSDPMPEGYRGLITQNDYEQVMVMALRYFEEKGIAVAGTGPGEIILAGEDAPHCYLDNLVRKLAAAERADWKRVIHDHFDLLKDHSAAYNFFYKDFEYAAPLLRVLLKPDDSELGDRAEAFVLRTDLPGTFSCLVMEFENQFHFVRRDESAEWGQTDDELFAIALANLPTDEIEATEFELEEKYTAITFTSGDFAPALILDLEARIDGAVGPFGCLVAVPSKQAAVIHPIENEEVLEVAALLVPWVNDRYENDQSPINPHFYWYHEGRFEMLPEEERDGERILFLPEALGEMLA